MSSHRYLVFGVGQTGRMACRMLIDSGARIIGVYGRESHVGTDVGELVGRPSIGLAVQPASDFVPRREDADVALFFTTSLMADLMGDAQRCLAAGLRVMTIAEDAAFPWSHAPALAHALDATAKAAGSALLSSGMNDVPMVHLPLGLAAMSRDVRRISSTSVGNFGRLGAATLLHMGIGGSVAEFERVVHAEASPGTSAAASIAVTVGQAMAAASGLEVRSTSHRVMPVIAQRPLDVPTLGRTLAAGDVRGIHEVAELRTDAFAIEVELIGLVFEPGDEERCTARVHGMPSFEMNLSPRDFDGTAEADGFLPGFSEATVAIALNRIPELMAAPPGLLSIDRLAGPRFHRIL